MENQPKKLIVVDLTRALAGPYCSMMLGDIGAEIITILRTRSALSTKWAVNPCLTEAPSMPMKAADTWN